MTLGDRVAVMRAGLLQQVGSPKELYDEPVNLFVAGFIGSPSMNFLGGTLEDSKLRTSLGDFRLSDRMRREVESSGSGREVIVGLRPENFEDAALVSPENRPHGLTFHATPDVLESMGSDVFVYFTRGREQGVTATELEELAKDSGRADTGGHGDTIVARLDAATTIREGHDAELWVDARAMHVFDPTTGRNLSLAATDGGTVTGGATAGAAAGGATADMREADAAAHDAADTHDAGTATQEASGMAPQGRHAASEASEDADSGGSGGEVT
jgi:multiple sugar transport system ATP-binding protein